MSGPRTPRPRRSRRRTLAGLRVVTPPLYGGGARPAVRRARARGWGSGAPAMPRAARDDGPAGRCRSQVMSAPSAKVHRVRSGRQCTRSACGRPAVATLTYVYSDSTAVLGPLATLAEPHSYDLCAVHAERLTAPRGCEVVRLLTEFTPAEPSRDDLLALEIGRAHV